MGLALGLLANRIGAELRGDPDCLITSVGSLEQAGEGALSFLANARYRKYLATTRASAIILQADYAGQAPGAVLVVANPYAAFARAATLISPPVPPEQGVHPATVIGEDCRIDASAWIGPNCVLADGVDIGAGVQLAAGCVVGEGSVLGAGTVLYPNVVIRHAIRIGARVMIHPGAVIGSDGFGHAREDGRWLKVPQLGGVSIGNDVEIGANTTIDRGALDDTVIEDGVRLDNQIQVAHNVHIGAHTVIAGCVGISGSARIGKHCMIGGGVGIVGHLEITDHVTVTGMTMVTQSIDQPGVYSSGLSAQESTAWCRNTARLRQLDELARRLQALERKSADG
ncbi:MAG: UDP-3-O-(3-hydroxymyristoyl)glucosamine N-acyltransferase [Pseudomonadota bacterium]